MLRPHLSVVFAIADDNSGAILFITQSWFDGTEIIEQTEWVTRHLTDMRDVPERGQEIAWAHDALQRAMSEFETWRYLKAAEESDPLRVDPKTRK